MTKPLHVGFAARDGVEAALFAQAGMTASPNVIAGALGFFDVCSPDHGELDWITDCLGHPFEVIDRAYRQSSIRRAAKRIRRPMRFSGNARRGASRTRCPGKFMGMTPAAHAGLVYHDPTTPLQAKFSQEYCLAAPLVFGRLDWPSSTLMLL